MHLKKSNKVIYLSDFKRTHDLLTGDMAKHVWAATLKTHPYLQNRVRLCGEKKQVSACLQAFWIIIPHTGVKWDQSSMAYPHAARLAGDYKVLKASK